MSEPQDHQAGRDMSLVTKPVSCLLTWRSVIAQPIGLNDQSELWPMEVDTEAVESLLSQWFRQSRGPNEPEEHPLKLRVCEPEGAPIEKATEGPDTGEPPVCVELRPERFSVNPTEFVCLVYGRLKWPLLEFCREVDQGESWRGHRDLVLDSAIHISESAAVNFDSNSDTRT
jgi:hypothetical protein